MRIDNLGFSILPEALEQVIEQREAMERSQGFFNDPAG